MTKRKSSSKSADETTVSPKKKQKRVYLSACKVRLEEGTQPEQHYPDRIVTETAGPFGMLVVVSCVQHRTGLGGYLGTLMKEGKSHYVDRIENPFIDDFDCRIYTPLYQRISHDNNNKKGQGYLSQGKEYNRLAFVGSPDRMDPDEDNLAREKRFRDACVKELIEKGEPRAGKVTTYVPWDPLKHSKTPLNGLRSLDKFLTDESVGDVIGAYMVPKKIPKKGVYKYLRDKKMGNLYSRKESTKMYSAYAQETYGFPGTPGEQSDYEDEDEEENGVE